MPKTEEIRAIRRTLKKNFENFKTQENSKSLFD